jgi:hypothetical protein
LTTFDHLALRVITEARLGDLGITPEYALFWLRSRLQDVITEMPFGDVNRQPLGAFNTVAPYTTGTVNVTQGSDQVVGVNTAFNSVMDQWFLRVGGTRVWYQVVSITDTTHLTLDQPYVDANATGASFFLGPRYYTLPLGSQWVTQLSLPQRPPLIELSLERLQEMFPERIASPSAPQYWAHVNWDESEVKRSVELYPIADAMYRVEFSGYANVDQPTLFNEPPIGIDDQVLVSGALADAFNYRAGVAAASDKGVESVRALLDVASRHQTVYERLRRNATVRDNLNASQPPVHVRIQRFDQGAYYDPVVTAEDDVWMRP